jgi:transposase
MRYVGLDVHKRTVRACVVDAAGEQVYAGDLACTREALQGFARRHLRPDDRVALEATTNTWAVVDVLKPFVASVTTSNPLRTKAIAEAKVKTDKVDARTLADLLRCDYLPTVWEPDEHTRSLRKLTTLRASLVNDRTRIKNRVRCILAQRLVEPPMAWLYGGKGLAWLKAVELPAEERTMIECQLRLLEATERELADLDERLQKLAYEEARAKLLMTLPGVGHGTALALLAALGDVSRFRDGDHAASYLGLVPSTRQSADRCYHGPITKAGNSHARWMLTQGVQHLATNPGPLGVFYRRLCRRKNRNVAVTAAARKLVTIAYLMLRDNEPYRYAIPQATDRKLSRVRFSSTGVRRKAERKADREPDVAAGTTAAAATPPEGSTGHAGPGDNTSAKRVRRTRSLPTIYRDEGLPPARTVDQLPAGERRMLVDGGTIAFARQIQEPSPPPRR